MPTRLVRQPNGLYAEFSTVVDHFTAVEMTRAEAIEWGRTERTLSAADAIAKVDRADADLNDEGKPYSDDGLGRWCDSLHTILLIHGTAKLATFLNEYPQTYAPPTAPKSVDAAGQNG